MVKINKIHGIPGIGSSGDEGETGNRGYNTLYSDIIISGDLNMSKSIVFDNISMQVDSTNSIFLTPNLENAVNNILLEITFEDEINASINISINSSEKYTFYCTFINKNNDILKNEYCINDDKIPADNIQDIVLDISCCIKDNKKCIINNLLIYTSANIKIFEFSSENPIYSKNESIIIPNFDIINTNDLLIDGNKNAYIIKKDGNKLSFTKFSESPNLELFTYNDNTIYLNNNLLLQNSLYSIDEIYDNNLNNNMLILASNDEFIKMYNTNSDDANTLSVKYVNKDNKFKISASNDKKILCNNLLVNAGNLLTNKYGYDIPDKITIDISTDDISANSNENSDASVTYKLSIDGSVNEYRLKNLMITDTSNNIIKDFNDISYVYNSNMQNFLLYYKYNVNGASFLNTMYYNNEINLPKIINCKVTPENCIVSYDKFNINISNVILGQNILAEVTYDKDVSINGVSSNNQVYSFNDVSTNIKEDKKITYDGSKSAQTSFNITIKEPEIIHTNKITISDPSSFKYLDKSDIVNGVPVNCVLMVFEINCEDRKDDTQVNIMINSTFNNNPENSKAYNNSVLIGAKIVDSIQEINTSNMITKSITGDTITKGCSDYISVYGTKSTYTSNLELNEININQNDKKFLCILYDISKDVPKEYITIDKITTNINLNINDDTISSIKKNTFLYPITLSTFCLAPEHTYNLNINSSLMIKDSIYNRISYNRSTVIKGSENKNLYDNITKENVVASSYFDFNETKHDDIYNIVYNDISTYNYSFLHFKYNSIYKNDEWFNLIVRIDHTTIPISELQTQCMGASFNTSGHIQLVLTNANYSQPISLNRDVILTPNYEPLVRYSATWSDDISINNIWLGINEGFTNDTSRHYFINSKYIHQQYVQANQKIINSTNALYSCYYNMNNHIHYDYDNNDGHIFIMDQPRLSRDLDTWQTGGYQLFE